jgi:hypothetical protein
MCGFSTSAAAKLLFNLHIPLEYSLAFMTNPRQMPGIKNPFAKTMVMDLAGKEVGLAAAWATQPTVHFSFCCRRLSSSLFYLLSYSPFHLLL